MSICIRNTALLPIGPIEPPPVEEPLFPVPVDVAEAPIVVPGAAFFAAALLAAACFVLYWRATR